MMIQRLICSLQLTVFQKVRTCRIAIILLTMIYIGILSASFSDLDELTVSEAK